MLLRPDTSHCQPVAGGFVSIHVIDISSDSVIDISSDSVIDISSGSVMGDCGLGSLGFSGLSIVRILTMTLWSLVMDLH